MELIISAHSPKIQKAFAVMQKLFYVSYCWRH